MPSLIDVSTSFAYLSLSLVICVLLSIVLVIFSRAADISSRETVSDIDETLTSFTLSNKVLDDSFSSIPICLLSIRIIESSRKLNPVDSSYSWFLTDVLFPYNILALMNERSVNIKSNDIARYISYCECISTKLKYLIY